MAPRRRAPLSQLGEFGLINQLATAISPSLSSNVLRGIGDDAAVVRFPRNRELLLTTDALVECVHFDRRWDAPHDIGWKAMVANLSDIAAMNGDPLCAVVAIGLPIETPTEWITACYRGLNAAAKQFNTPIVGGDTVRSPAGIVISIAMVGSVQRQGFVGRSGARPGDLIYVTGELGTCAAALTMLSHSKSSVSKRSSLLGKHRHPMPRFDILSTLHERKIRPSSMIDISDGLVSDLQHISESSGVQCAINSEKIPVHRGLKTFAAHNKKTAAQLALHSGEEYELAFTVPQRWEQRANTIDGITMIGRIQTGTGVVDTSTEIPVELTPLGFQHFT